MPRIDDASPKPSKLYSEIEKKHGSQNIMIEKLFARFFLSWQILMTHDVMFYIEKAWDEKKKTKEWVGEAEHVL